MEIKQLKVITEDVVVSFDKLMSQLSENRKPSYESLNELVQSNNLFLFVAIEDERILGTLTLITYNIPTGQKVWIEDVVVDSSARGKGIGRKLVQYAIDFAKSMGLSKIDLTSSFDRQAANELYKSMGFEKRDTNVYRLICD
jgi:ribosomal protein S18 acetylase RimI-like enzyme